MIQDTRYLAPLQRLAEIVVELREKCPWDREQTIESLRHLTIEETYELSDAILAGDTKEIKVELGDILLHILFYSMIGEEEKQFTFKDVIEALIDKLIRRHPHVYGDKNYKTFDEVLENWEKIKGKENRKRPILSGVPQSLPSLIKALRMQEKASNVGFDWEDKSGLWNKIKEEIAEFERAETKKNQEEEMGDLLFTLVNYCRFAKINPEDALAKANHKFQSRFEYIEQKALAEDRVFSELSPEEMDIYWEEAKRILNKG